MTDYICALYQRIKAELSQKGQGIVEYALILAFVAVVAAALTSSGDLASGIAAAFQKIVDVVNPTP